MQPQNTRSTHATIFVKLVCQFIYAEALFDFEGWLKKHFIGKHL